MARRIILLLVLGIMSPHGSMADHHHHHHHHHEEDHKAPHTDPASDSLSVPVATSYSASSSPKISSGYSSAPKSSVSSKASSSAALKQTPGAQERDSSYSAPSPTYNAPAPAASSSSSSYSAPAAAAAPATSYSAPAPAPAPAVSTGNLYYYYYPVAAYPIHNRDSSPHPSHGIKPSFSTTYSAPSSSYGHSAASSSNDNGFGFLFILVPIILLLLAIPFLALIGTNVNTGRSFDGVHDPSFYRSSELDEKFGSFAELQAEIDLLLAKYVTALDSEQCMDRIVCELGVKASAIPSKGLLFSVVEWLAPANHALLGKQRIDLMRTAATDRSYTMTTCKKFVCNPPAIISDGLTLDDLKFRSNKKPEEKQQQQDQVY